MKKKPCRVLVAPLDWGLGHTTRCLPLIGWLQRNGHHVIVACNDWQRSFIEKTINGIEIIHLAGYNIKYSNNEKWAKAALIQQIPKIRAAINREHQWLLQNLHQINPDAILSDNRYGLHHPDIPSVIMTHQLTIQTGVGRAADRLVQKLHYHYLARFNEVWVPDVKTTPNLGGALSHSQHLPVKKTEYIGYLSQFEHLPSSYKSGEYLLILLSGPEPQRTILSNILWSQCLAHNGKIIFVAGSTTAERPTEIPGHITFHDRLAGRELAGIISGAEMVVCRSGYSTLMDLILLGKKAILIPTPGQTEQEYLAAHLHQQGIMMSTGAQSGFDLQSALAKAPLFPFHSLGLQRNYHEYEGVMQRWMSDI